ncbi:cell surface glycoprotein CD200 receptor 1-A isoform X2 [Thunnus maccoyii]|uniref:cell surface glycoprotein CD200 receptor 1-A isoform X2 n=1 Tax=Thunnus maccoyii TaxID=8240 RepID=UPI001C4AF61A|nr:cell surface glycoprotein CD200 receptor 1-A isoform X2 [Thunnus maccoyii]
MRGMMWVFAVFILSVYETWSLDTGSPQSTLMNTSSSAPKVYVVRNASFNLGSDVNLTCSNESRSEIMFVLWKIELKYKDCRIAHSNDGQSEDSCNDGKSLENTPTIYLHIPNFSNDDVGTYQCETVYTGGADAHMINVDIIAPPSISAWLERKGNKTVAVCKAESGKPAANISWSHLENSSSSKTWLGSDGFFIVESRLELPENMDPKNLSCTIRHQSWEGEKTLVPKFTKDSHFTLICILTVVISIAVLAGILFLAQKKLTILRCSKQADTSPSKPLPTAEDVEEVEPYASYVQRVNSIYNS